MLARANRLVHADDFREVVRRGRRVATPHAIYYRVEREATDPLRMGFIVSKAVGGAVERNRVRRRLRAVGREFVDSGARGHDVVVRALAGAAAVPGNTLMSSARAALTRSLETSR